jgi:hypothetical protein
VLSSCSSSRVSSSGRRCSPPKGLFGSLPLRRRRVLLCRRPLRSRFTPTYGSHSAPFLAADERSAHGGRTVGAEQRRRRPRARTRRRHGPPRPPGSRVQAVLPLARPSQVQNEKAECLPLISEAAVSFAEFRR